MGDFFHGWRRKAGIGTLLIAFAVTGLWIRSLTTIDRVEYSDSFTTWRWSSHHGLLSLKSYEHGKVIPAAIRKKYFWKHQQLQTRTFADYQDFISTSWPWKYFGMGYHRGGEPRVETEFRVRCSTIAVPMMILSAWLLISRPRRSPPPASSERSQSFR